MSILQNALLGIRPVARIALRFHSGIGEDAGSTRPIFDRFSSAVPVAGKDILEIGPGKGWEMGRLALAQGARSYASADVTAYWSPEEAGRIGIRHRLFDGRRLPFPDAAFDLGWSVASFEHFRYPKEMISEISRVLRPGGSLLCDVDLRDHYHLPDESRWLDCLRYPEPLWRAMAWYRSGYVNRLRFSEWRAIFSGCGFEEIGLQPNESGVLAASRPQSPWLSRWSASDVRVYSFRAVLRKPATSP